MRHKQLKLSVVLFLGLTGLQAQTSVNATGGNAFGSGGSVSFSVGLLGYTTNTGTNGSVAQGVQQPYEISVITGIEKAQGIQLSVSAYPNPTNNFLQLKVENEKLYDLTFQLYDMNGRHLQSEKIIEAETSIDMSNLVTATYFVKVKLNDKVLKVFKIIKK